MMQVQGSNMMDGMGGNTAASFWGARPGSWSTSPAGNHSSGHAAPGSAGAGAANNSNDPKMAEKLMTELQVSQYKVRKIKLNFKNQAWD